MRNFPVAVESPCAAIPPPMLNQEPDAIETAHALTEKKMIASPLKVAGVEGQYDLRVRVHGGGLTGQAGAVRHGIARALVEANPELRIPLKREGYLSRDARQVERKKAGLHKARKAPQFSKR